MNFAMALLALPELKIEDLYAPLEQGTGACRIGLHGEYFRPDFKDSKNLVSNVQGSYGIGGHLLLTVTDSLKLDARLAFTYFFEFSGTSVTKTNGYEINAAAIWRVIDMLNLPGEIWSIIHPYAGIGFAVNIVNSSTSGVSVTADPAYGGNFIVGVSLDLTPQVALFAELDYKYRVDNDFKYTVSPLPGTTTSVTTSGPDLMVGINFRT